MNAISLLSMLTKGFIPVENCGTANFGTSDLSELQTLFGKNYAWRGYMFEGDLLYIYHQKNADWFCDEYDLLGYSLEDENEEIYVFHVKK